MTINYQVLVLQSERPEWLSSLQQAISACLKNLGLHASMNVDVTEELLERCTRYRPGTNRGEIEVRRAAP